MMALVRRAAAPEVAGRRVSIRFSLQALRAAVALVLLAALATACAEAGAGASSPESPGAELTVFAAASLTEAFTEAGAAFEAANPGTRVTFNFAGSSRLRAQLAQGARADVLATADESTMEGARSDGTIAGDARVFAQNRLVAIVPKENPGGISALVDLSKPGVKLVLAHPDVPVGNYALQALDKMSQDPAFPAGFEPAVLANVVSQESNVREVVAKVQLGEADAGIVYVSDVTPDVRDAVVTIEIPDALNVVARYPIAVVAGASNEAAAESFIHYLLSPAGQAILARHGLLPVGPIAPTGASETDRG